MKVYREEMGQESSPEQLSEPHSVARVLHHSQLDVRGELLPEVVKLSSVQLLDHVQHLKHPPPFYFIYFDGGKS